jgi:hypothetical protein
LRRATRSIAACTQCSRNGAVGSRKIDSTSRALVLLHARLRLHRRSSIAVIAVFVGEAGRRVGRPLGVSAPSTNSLIASASSYSELSTRWCSVLRSKRKRRR